MNAFPANARSAFHEDVDANLQSLLAPRYSGGDADVDSPVETFHEHTKYHRDTFQGQCVSIVKYLSNPAYIARAALGYKRYSFLEALELPPPAEVGASLADAIAQRRSCRTFEPRMTLAEVSTLFHHALRVNRVLHSKIAPSVEVAFRPYPSPGGLNTIETYAFLNDIEGVPPCTAHYDARAHRFRILKKHDRDAFSRVEISEGGNVVFSPLTIVMTMVSQRATAKYGGRGYRLNLLEAGHAAQNVCLVAEGIGLTSLVFGAYYDDEVAAALGVDGVTEGIATVLKVGRRGNPPATEPGRVGKYE